MTATPEEISTGAAIIEDACSQLPGLTPEFAGRALEAVLREALARTEAWVVEFRLNTRAGITDCALDTRVPGTRVSTVLAVTYNGQPLVPRRPQLQESEPVGTPRCWHMPYPGSIRLFPAPALTQSGSLSVRGALTTLDSAEVVPEAVLLPLREALTQGTLARLYAMPGKPWSSAPLALYAKRAANRQMNLLRAEVGRSTTPEGRAWHFPQGWTRRG